MNKREILSVVSAIIATAEKFKNSFFWRSPNSARGRRDYEKYWTIPAAEFEYNGVKYSVAYYVECTCNNIYAHGEYYRDGKKTTLTAIKNVHKKLIEEGVTII